MKFYIFLPEKSKRTHFNNNKGFLEMDASQQQINLKLLTYGSNSLEGRLRSKRIIENLVKLLESEDFKLKYRREK